MNSPRAVQSYHTVVVCGGGCYGGYYLRQLARARQAGALVVDRIIVVDRDAQCQVCMRTPGLCVALIGPTPP
jgi:hypothetical protein